MGEVRHSQAEKIAFLLIFPCVPFCALNSPLFGRFQEILTPGNETRLPITIYLPFYI